MDLVAKFMELHTGLPEAFGTGAGRWIKRPPERDDFEAHLNGEGAGIGIAPLRRDGTVRFAAIDLDEPDFNAARAMQSMLPGPTWLERSRSGNAHVLVYFADPAPAWAVRGLLTSAAAAAGKPRAEVFPKQSALRPDMLGNYINLSYHGDDRPVLNGIDPNQPPYDVATFVGKALYARHWGSDWADRARRIGHAPPEEQESTTEWGEQANLHRCAEYMLERSHDHPVGEGSRHQAVFFMAKALANWREADEDLAWAMLDAFNESGVLPPLPESELRRAHNNAWRGRFTSTGCDDPLLADYVDPDCPIASGKVGG